MNRYIYAQALTREKALARLENFYATGEISEVDNPMIEPAPFGYVITILENNHESN
tara:strand:+ start:1107 stop:1274 length:168 start_codon:yes stop_codon:yes gene_type:complete